MPAKRIVPLIFVLGGLVLALWALRNPGAMPSATSQRLPGALGALASGDARLVDLTHAFDEQTVYWPTEIPFHLERGFAGVTEGGWYYSSNRFHMAEHSGTHVDAPIHFAAGNSSVDQIPLEQFVGPAAVIDVVAECQANPDYVVPRGAFEAWEQQHRRSLDGMIVLVRTGWDRFWPDREKYLGTAATGREALAKLHFPGVDPAAAHWLATQRRIKAIGIDTASIDYGQTKNFGTHVILCEHGIPAFENVAQLAGLPPLGFTVIALPMKIASGSGGPLRIIAVLPK